MVSEEAVAADKQLSDELTVEAEWLWGKVANLPKAFQLPPATVCVFLFVFVQHFIPNHASENRHSCTQTARRQNNFGSRGLSIKPKRPARI